jgi:hypothetical protein
LAGLLLVQLRVPVSGIALSNQGSVQKIVNLGDLREDLMN